MDNGVSAIRRAAEANQYLFAFVYEKDDENFLHELHREGRTIIMVTHDQRLAGRAQRALRLVKGALQ